LHHGDTYSRIHLVSTPQLPTQKISYKQLPICNYIRTPLSTAEIYYCDAIEQTSIARYPLCVDCLRDAGHRLSQRVHSSVEQEGTKCQLLQPCHAMSTLHFRAFCCSSFAPDVTVIKTLALCLQGPTLFIKHYTFFSVTCRGEKKCVKNFNKETVKELLHLKDISGHGG
jgi:hypothetical protein